MRTFKQIQDEIILKLKEDSVNPNYWTLQEIKDAINDTYLFIADETLCFKLDEIISVVANIRTYKLPYNYISGSLKRVEFNEKVIHPITSNELDVINSGWRSVSGTPTHYLPPGDICNTDELALYPIPDTSGSSYNTASDYGVITTIGDDSYEEFNEEEGVIVSTDGEARFDETEGTGPVLDIEDPENNIHIFAAKYPKRLFNDEEVFLHPITFNPRGIITNGSLALLFAKEGRGKDIAKSSYFNKRFMENMQNGIKTQKINRTHRMRSITEISTGEERYSGLNIGENYPAYMR